jgi:hypothetical protein
VTRWLGQRSTGQRVVIVLAVVLLSINLVGSLLSALYGREPGGPAASSYSTGADGIAGLARLYDSDGLRVRRIRSSLDQASLDPDTTLVLAEPELLLREEVDAVQRFVSAGGRLVAIGPSTVPLVREITGASVSIARGGPERWLVLAPTSDTGGATSVLSDNRTRIEGFDAALPIFGDRGAVTVATAEVGAGVVVLAADVSPLENDNLGAAGNAAFGLGLAGGRDVVFEEASHGFTTGLGALPSSWLRAVAIAFAAVLLGMWSVARRLGPPEEGSRALPPPRRAYVDAVATALARTGDRFEAIEPMQRNARERLALRLGQPLDAARADLDAAGQRAGIDSDDIALLYRTPHNDDELVAIAAAAARLRGETR